MRAVTLLSTPADSTLLLLKRQQQGGLKSGGHSAAQLGKHAPDTLVVSSIQLTENSIVYFRDKSKGL